jgi:hypothetical protein
VQVQGHAADDTYVSAVAINGRPQFIELAESRLPFTQEITLRDGANTVDIVAVDLVGRLARQQLTVTLDRQGPLLSLDRLERLGTQRARLVGLLSDRSRVVRFVLAGQTVSLPPGQEWEFREEVPLTPGTTAIPFEAEDAAGNVTRGAITLAPGEGGPPGVREGALPPVQGRLFAEGVLPNSLSPWEWVGVRGITAAVTIEHETVERCALPDVLPEAQREAIATAARMRDPHPYPLPEGEGAQARWASLAPGLVVSDLVPARAVPFQVAQGGDQQPPVIKLTDLGAQQTTYYDTIYLEGRVTDASLITALTINGESLWRRESQQLFFGYIAALQPGENRFVLEAVDKPGNKAQHVVMVQRHVEEVKRLEARLRVTLLPPEKKGPTATLAETVYDHLLTVFVNQGRFHLVERERLEAILREQQLSQTALVDPDTAVKIGKIAAAEGMLLGTVTETPNALEVFTRFVDVETATVLAAVDVYGEDLNLRTVGNLMEGLALKLRQRFPLVEGIVVKREGKNIFLDRGSKHALQKYMKAILFRDGAVITHPITGKPLGSPTELLGEARIDAVFEDFSQATLLHSGTDKDVKQLDKVITK